ncbi:MAG: SRPBCC domain-containing protein [Phenylobacterium sp.]|uniref:SRPBCC domain-containing protein n=1 Tax=Phenylobacterium sp. TaxID=1871053 RepID=UPI0027344671|nr:SRPBCC domain-containing protein [Phenylobacterium sp.]MDP3176121.1 SRPBCC domain-containing protein [Phenylobacterium sp.]
MAHDERPRARVTMLIKAPAQAVFGAFIDPAVLAKFWLSSASAPLSVGEPVEWRFMVDGATARPVATRLVVDEHIAWRWSDGTVQIDLAPFDGGTAITVINEGFPGDQNAQMEAALDATEGFCIVLCDLKTLLESGRSAGLTRAKAQLIEARR